MCRGTLAAIASFVALFAAPATAMADVSTWTLVARTNAIVIEQREFGGRFVYVDFNLVDPGFSPLVQVISTRCDPWIAPVCEIPSQVLGNCPKQTIVASTTIAGSGEHVTFTVTSCTNQHTSRCLNATGKMTTIGLLLRDFTPTGGCQF